MSQVQYALDMNDEPTRAMLGTLGVPARRDHQMLQTQVQYLVTDVGVMGYHDLEHDESLSQLPKYGIVIHRRMESFEGAPSQMVQLVDRQGKTVRERYDDGKLSNGQGDASSLYILNAVEAKAAIDSGIYDNQDAFVANLKHNLVGSSYLVPDQVSLSTQTYDLRQQTMNLIASNGQAINPVVKVVSAQPVTTMFVFNSKNAESNFGAILYNKLQQMGAVNQEAMAKRQSEEIQQATKNPVIAVVQTSVSDDLVNHAKRVSLQDDINKADRKNAQSRLDATLNAMDNDRASDLAKVVTSNVTGQKLDEGVNQHPESFDINDLAVDDIAETDVSSSVPETSASKVVSSNSSEDENDLSGADFSGLVALTAGLSDDSSSESPTSSQQENGNASVESEGQAKSGAFIDTNSTAEVKNDQPVNDQDLMAQINQLANMKVPESATDNLSDREDAKRQQQRRNAQIQEEQNQLQDQLKKVEKAKENGDWTFDDGTMPGMSGDETKMLRQLSKAKKNKVVNNQSTQRRVQRQQRIDEMSAQSDLQRAHEKAKSKKGQGNVLDLG